MTALEARFMIELYIRGAIAIHYFGHLIALVDSEGRIQWHDKSYPVYLINYLLTIPTYEQAIRN